MAILRSTQVQGKLEVINSDLYVTGSGSLIHGNLDGKAKVAESLDPTKDFVIGTTEATHSLTVNGNLKVTGDVVYTDTANLRVKDKNIELNVDEKGNAASSRVGASGAGITVKAVKADGTKEDVTLTYDSTKNAWTSNVPFDVSSTTGTVAKAEHANIASRVEHTLKNGTGISSFTFDGSADATVQVDDSHIKAVKVNSASAADVAGKTEKTLEIGGNNSFITLIDSASKVKVDTYDGSVKTVLEVKVDSALSETSENPIQNKVVSEKINKLWEKQFPISVQASANPNWYEFDGKDHTITVTWKAVNGKASAVTINGTAVSVGNGETGTSTYTKSSQGTTSYSVAATIDGKSRTTSTSANAYLPSFVGTSTAATAADLNVTGLEKKVSSIKGTVSVSAPTASGTNYIWFCAPSGTTISKVTSAGFGVNLKAVETKKVTVGGQEFTYNCYRGVGPQTTAMTYVIS